MAKEAAKTFEIELLGFPGREARVAADSLAQVFEIPVEEALQYVEKAPLTVLTHADRTLMTQYVRVLRELGADVRVTRSETGKSWVMRAGSDTPEPDQPRPRVATRPHAAARKPSQSMARARAGGRKAARSHRSDLHIRTYAPPDLTVAQDGRAEEITPGALFKADIEFRGRTLDLPHVSVAHETPEEYRRTRPESPVPGRRGRSKAAMSRQTRGVLALSAGLLALFLVFVIQYAELPEKLIHTSATGSFSVTAPRGFVDEQTNTGSMRTSVGTMSFTAHTVRTLGDPNGFFLFAHLVGSGEMVQGATDTQIMQATLDSTMTRYSGQVASQEAITYETHLGIEAFYGSRRYGHDFQGRVRIYRIGGEIVVVMCEGIGDVCRDHPRAHKFFDSFEFDPRD